MKIKFEDKKWFNFLRKKLPANTFITKSYLGQVVNRNSEIEITVAKTADDLRKFIKTSIPDELKRSVDKNWNIYRYDVDGFNIDIRYCFSPSFPEGPGIQDVRLYVPGRFLDDFIFDTDPPDDYKEPNNNKEKKENKMANNSNIWGMTKDDFKDGLWRNGANEMVEVVKFAVLKACKVQKMNRIMYETVRKTLDYKVVTGGIHAALGYALTYVPMLSSHPQAARMAKELRVEGFKFIQSEVIDAIKDLVPDLLKILSTVSPEETEQRIQVGEKNETKRISTPELVEHQASMEVMAEKEITQVKRATAAI